MTGIKSKKRPSRAPSSFVVCSVALTIFLLFGETSGHAQDLLNFLFGTAPQSARATHWEQKKYGDLCDRLNYVIREGSRNFDSILGSRIDGYRFSTTEALSESGFCFIKSYGSYSERHYYCKLKEWPLTQIGAARHYLRKIESQLTQCLARENPWGFVRHNEPTPRYGPPSIGRVRPGRRPGDRLTYFDRYFYDETVDLELNRGRDQTVNIEVSVDGYFSVH